MRGLQSLSPHSKVESVDNSLLTNLNNVFPADIFDPIHKLCSKQEYVFKNIQYYCEDLQNYSFKSVYGILLKKNLLLTFSESI